MDNLAPLTQPPRQARSKCRLVFSALGLFIVLPFACAIIALFLAGPLTENKTLVIARGTSVKEIAHHLDENGIIYSPYLFRLAAKMIALDELKAGEYAFTPDQSIADIALMMHEGHSIERWLTIAEGLTTEEITKLLNENIALTGAITKPAEGTVLPETYRYSYGDTRSAMLGRMEKSMRDVLNELWDKRDPSLPLKSPEEAVIMASVIEKETGLAEERPRIAGVFYNRLGKNMRLQSDPTVIYAITLARGPMNRTLSHDDLGFASPYNTYASDGLPPQPICNPGRAALEAALHPEKNDFLYFVADGTGGHAFARDLTEHNQNVFRWQHIKPKP